MEVYLVQPRGFCAGVRHALEIVRQTLRDYGAPIYIRHEIVHNKHVINDLKQQGIIFVDELTEVKDKSRPVIFSAHGVAEEVKEQADKMNIKSIDATCPLVNAVHQQIRKLEQVGAEIIVIGKPTHPEILGTIGQLKDKNKAHVVSNQKEAEQILLNPSTKVGIVTQTTLSVDETKEIVAILKRKFPTILNASKPNICFATTNRQKAIQKLAQTTKNILIIGSKNSSNSTHLKEAALRYGAQKAWLIDDASEVDWEALDKCAEVGISAGASAPEHLIEELIDSIKERYNNVNIHHVIVAQENINFK